MGLKIGEVISTNVRCDKFQFSLQNPLKMTRAPKCHPPFCAWQTPLPKFRQGDFDFIFLKDEKRFFKTVSNKVHWIALGFENDRSELMNRSQKKALGFQSGTFFFQKRPHIVHMETLPLK